MYIFHLINTGLETNLSKRAITAINVQFPAADCSRTLNLTKYYYYLCITRGFPAQCGQSVAKATITVTNTAINAVTATLLLTELPLRFCYRSYRNHGVAAAPPPRYTLSPVLISFICTAQTPILHKQLYFAYIRTSLTRATQTFVLHKLLEDYPY